MPPTLMLATPREAIRQAATSLLATLLAAICQHQPATPQATCLLPLLPPIPMAGLLLGITTLQDRPTACSPTAPWIDPQAAQRLHKFHAHEAAGKALKMKLLAAAAAI